VLIVAKCQRCGPLPYAFNPVAVDPMRILASNIDAAKMKTCRICGGNVTLTEETDAEQVRKYIEEFLKDQNYRDELARQIILDFFMTYDEKKTARDSLAKVNQQETMLGRRAVPLNDVYRELGKRAIDRHVAFQKLRSPDERQATFAAAPGATLAENAEILRAAVTGADDELLNLVLGGNSPRLLRLIRHVVFMHIMPNLCEGCSRCCEQIRTIGLHGADEQRIASYLKMPRGEFEAKYVRTVKDEKGRPLRTFNQTAPCVWLKDGRCVIYSARPNVCVFYPFLTDLQQPESWKIVTMILGVDEDVVPPLVPPYCRSGLAVLELLKS